MKKIILPLVLLWAVIGMSQTSGDSVVQKERYYHFSLINGEKLFTMKQTDENYSSGCRVLFRLLNQKPSIKSRLVQIGVSFLGGVIAHEEGHRSVLTEMGIGSVSQPFSIFTGSAYVTGVTDASLMELRDNDTPTYLRLHTAGLESNYAVDARTQSLLAFEEDDYHNLRVFYLSGKGRMLMYYLTSLVPRWGQRNSEEANELDRDVVGQDLYGMTKNLFRPTGEFHRYVSFDELTHEEQRFVRRVAWMSLLNLASPMVIGKQNFAIGENVKVNAALGYSVAPFGGFLDQKFWFMYKDKLKLHGYVREFHNKDHWFMGTGIQLSNYNLWEDRVVLNSELHLWTQPKNLDFFTSEKESGMGGAIDIGYKVLDTNGGIKKLYATLGVSHKTDGFLMEYASLKKRTLLDVGLSIAW